MRDVTSPRNDPDPESAKHSEFELASALLGPENRQAGLGKAALVGLVAGVATYALAERLLPSTGLGLTEFDLLLARRLLWLYSAAVAVWLGWLQRSWRRGLYGIGIGVVLGAAYTGTSESSSVMVVAVPCALGGAYSALVGSNHSQGLAGLFGRIARGLAAGFVLGAAYLAVLTWLTSRLVIPDVTGLIQDCIAMTRDTGPIAFGVASALFFPLVRWAVGLTRPSFP